MPRLIDANEILKSEHQHYDYMADEYYVTVRDIENAPTIEPVKHGRWIHRFGDGHIEQAFLGGECSICGFMGTATNYCPNCGAIMDEDLRYIKKVSNMNDKLVYIEDVLNLFGIEDEDLYAKGVIEDAIYNKEIPTIDYEVN